MNFLYGGGFSAVFLGRGLDNLRKEEKLMKKSLNYALCYAIIGICAGVFYRELTRMNDFAGTTALGKAHTHFFVLGMFVYVIIALFAGRYDLYSEKLFKVFRAVYNVGVPLTGIMLCVRGTFEVLGTELSKGADKMISGIAGAGHMLTAAGFILLIIALKKACAKEKVAQ